MVTNEINEPRFEAVEAGICVKDRAGNVLSQNATCREICGDRVGQTCTSGCMALLRLSDQPLPTLGLNVYRAKELGSKVAMDIALAISDKHIISLLVPMGRRIEEISRRMSEFGLSVQENQVVALALLCKSNKEIARLLHVSPSTIKKHLYSVYGKVPARVLQEFRTAAQRN